jgi:hypothetical protein
MCAAAGLVVGGCADRGSEDRRAVEASARAQMEANTKAAAPLLPRILRAGDHQVVVVEVPSVMLGTMIERQRCFVWRDAEFKTASISCPNDDSSLDLSDDR